MKLQSLFSRPLSFRHGVHPAELKSATSQLPIQQMPFVDRYVLPLSQHLGGPSVPLVQPGQNVRRGQLIAKPSGFVSTALHAPVTGTVASIELCPHSSGKMLPAIVIRADPYASQQIDAAPLTDMADLSRDDAVQRVQDGGIVGMGGAAFPAHVKLKVPADKKVRLVMLNGCECEPYLTCDHRLMVERPGAVLRGLRLIMEILGVDQGYIGIELNKPDALQTIREQARNFPSIKVVALKVKYPQGAERMLIDAVFHQEVPTGKLPLDLEIVVQNVASAAALADYFDLGIPVIDRVLTVSGDGVRRPANLRVPIGTPIRDVVDACGGLSADTNRVILGGAMMGQAQKSLDVPVMKGTSGLLALTGASADPDEEQPCIRCGSCLEACPMFLNPTRLAVLVRAERAVELEHDHLMSCFECASCSYVCPSRIPLVQLMRMGKTMVRARKPAP